MVAPYVILALLLASSCQHSGQPQEIAPRTPKKDVEKLHLQHVNIYLQEKEQAIIEAYIKRQGLHMQASGEGYYREVVTEGTGRQSVQDGSMVSLVGKVMLLDGQVCYTYTTDNKLVFKVKQSASMTGLHYALNGLREGTRARFIFPSHLAYGLLGDTQRIPPRSVVVCDLEIAHIE